MGFHKVKTIVKTKEQLQAIAEGQKKDILQSGGIAPSQASEIRGNNYTSYSSQVKQAYDMYNARTKYGGSLLSPLVDLRCAFIGGAGISVVSNTEKTNKFIQDLFTYNNMYGSRFNETLLVGELEGKNLILLFPDKKEGKVKIRNFSWNTHNYFIDLDENDTDLIKRIYYKPKSEITSEKEIPIDRAVFIKLYGTVDKVIETSSKILKVLTNIENCDRIIYDMRANNHVFGLNILCFECKDQNEAKVIDNKISTVDVSQGFTYSGTAKIYFVSPSSEATNVLKEEYLLNLKIIANMINTPIHWLEWPELMSNRATAENMSEVINAGTLQQRIIYQEKIKEVIIKCMKIAKEYGFKGAVYDPDGFQVTLPLISLSTIKSLTEVWLPLQESSVISMSTLRNKVPEIDAETEKKLVDEEKKENMEMFQNNLDIEENKNNDENMEDKNDISSNKE